MRRSLVLLPPSCDAGPSCFKQLGPGLSQGITLHSMGLSENLLVPINHPSGESFQQNLLMASAKMGPK